MARQENFQTNITTALESFVKFTVSRVIAKKQDELLDMEVPADFLEALLDNYIELNLYSLADNSLIYSDVIQNANDAIYTRKIQYADGSHRTLLFIDFYKAALESVPAGEYSVTLNFFANEIGSSNKKILKVSRISPSRTEVELKLTDDTALSSLSQFALPRIPSEFVVPVLQQIFNQSDADELELPVSPVRITTESVYATFGNGLGDRIVEYGFDEDDGSRVGINTIIQTVLDDAYPLAVASVATKIEEGQKSFTETELFQYVTASLDIAYQRVFEDEVNNPQNYRFDLI